MFDEGSSPELEQVAQQEKEPPVAVSLETIISKYPKESFPGQTFLAPEERRIVFHGTQIANIDSLRPGFSSKNDRYAVFSHDIGIAASPKISADGTVTVWDPPPEDLSQGDKINLAITHPKEEGAEKSTIVRRGGKPGGNRPETFLHGENFAEILTFTPEQITYLHGMSLNLKDGTDLSGIGTLDNWVEKYTANFPDPGKLKTQVVRDGFNLPSGRLLQVMAVKSYESGLKTAATKALNKFFGDKTARTAGLESFPTLGVPAYEEYKKTKISAVV